MGGTEEWQGTEGWGGHGDMGRCRGTRGGHEKGHGGGHTHLPGIVFNFGRLWDDHHLQWG